MRCPLFCLCSCCTRFVVGALVATTTIVAVVVAIAAALVSASAAVTADGGASIAAPDFAIAVVDAFDRIDVAVDAAHSVPAAVCAAFAKS